MLSNPFPGLLRSGALLGLVLSLCLPVVSVVSVIVPAEVALADEVDDEVALREEWQARYRDLLRNAARLRRNITAAEENYKKASRKNYPRGEARERIVLEGEQSRRELVRVEAAIDRLKDDARGAGVRPGWLYDVEQEDFSRPAPAAKAENDDDREGRNPIYFEDQ